MTGAAALGHFFPRDASHPHTQVQVQHGMGYLGEEDRFRYQPEARTEEKQVEPIERDLPDVEYTPVRYRDLLSTSYEAR